eukprot:gene315-325_t
MAVEKKDEDKKVEEEADKDELLDEEDDFEEFELPKVEKDTAAKQKEFEEKFKDAGWDDEDADDNFQAALKKEIAKVNMGTRGFIVKCGRYLLVFVGAAVTAGATVAAAAAAAEAGTVAGSWPRISADAEAFAKAFQGVTATIDISEEEVAWVDVIAGQWMGVALPGGPAANSTEVPLHGFMRETEFLRSLHHQLPPVPVVLSCDRALIAERAGAALKIPEPSPGDSVVRLPSGSTLGLKFAGKPVAVLHNVEVVESPAVADSQDSARRGRTRRDASPAQIVDRGTPSTVDLASVGDARLRGLKRSRSWHAGSADEE